MRFPISDWRSSLAAACGFAACLLALTAAASGAQTKWTLTTADFRSRQVDLNSIDEAAGAKLSDNSVVPWDQLLLLDRAGGADEPRQAAGAATGKFIVNLAAGDQLRGDAGKLEGETLIWTSPAVGEMKLPLRQVTSIVRAAAGAGAGAVAPPPPTERRTEDVVSLANGDTVRGIVTDVTAQAVTVRTGDGADVPVPFDSVRSVDFASTAAPATTGAAAGASAGRAVRVRLSDTSVITAPRVRTSPGGMLVMSFGGGPSGGGPGGDGVGGGGNNNETREVPLDAVVAIEQINGPVSWLSSRAPADSIHTPMLDTARPARMDRTVTGKPIRFGERAYARGIGVAPYSKLTFPLDPRQGYTTFRTQYALDGGAGQYADVAVRITLDGKVVHERPKLTAGELSPVIAVPLGAAQSITLEVDFGANYGVQDRLNWIEPALVKGTR